MTATIPHRAPLRVLASALSAAVLVSCQNPTPRATPVTLDELCIRVSQPREVSFTNKQAGFYYTLTHGSQTSGWHGWHVFSTKILDDWAFTVDGRILHKEDVTQADVFPDLFVRRYHNGTRETVAMLDSVDALLVELENLEGETVKTWPLFADATSSPEFLLSRDARSLFVAKQRHTMREAQNEAPPWIGMRLVGEASEAVEVNEPLEQGGRFAPAGLGILAPTRRATLLLVAGDSPAQCQSLLDRLESEFPQALTRRRERMEAVLRRSFIRTNDVRFDKALHWAILSLDALVMHQGSPGIFAGLPWFSNYWGRDTFISLPGATLVTGRTEVAKEILLSFAQWQESDTRSTSYGRIPNLVTPSSIAYNTADGTPWFIIALEQYWRATGDTAFIRSMIPVVTRSIEGTIAHHTDRRGLLTHGDAETWMDAVGPSGPWSPRGNRANDIQALWYRQLLAGSSLIEDSVLAEHWRQRARALRSTFIEQFVDSTTGLLVDHLNTDGSRDTELRPNQFFVFATPELIPAKRRLFDAATPWLVYPHGVASLSPREEQFHPFHHYPPFYVQDAAYHNGIVWTWLAGPWIDAAVQMGHQDLAFTLTTDMTHQILDRSAVGTISELLDAVPRKGEAEPRPSGTFTQAWSLAEYIRVVYQTYLGISIDVPRAILTIRPRLPQGLDRVKAHIRFGSIVLPVEYAASTGKLTISVSSPPNAPPLRLEGDVVPSPTVRHRFSATVMPGSTSEFTVSQETILQRTGNGATVTEAMLPLQREMLAPQHPPQFADAVCPPDLSVLSGVHHRLLDHSAIKATNPAAQVIVDQTDPVGDDLGTGAYVYPQTPHLKAGSLDLTRVRICRDSANTYFELGFRNLSNPGWHPEYGFQLTFVAIAIDTDRERESGARRLGHNSNLTFSADDGYEQLILIGGGIRVLDDRDTVLGEYVPGPGDEKNPLGNARTKTIAFALPHDVLDSAALGGRLTILVGAQDDHGGAGIGEFRSVGPEAGEWNGGGRRRPLDPNVYDTMIIE